MTRSKIILGFLARRAPSVERRYREWAAIALDTAEKMMYIYGRRWQVLQY